MLSILYDLPKQDNIRHLWLVHDGDEAPYSAGTNDRRRRVSEAGPVLVVLPGLACDVGLGEALFLRQLHYWLQSASAKERDGRRWVFNTYEDWHEQFPFWSTDAIRRIVKSLETQGLIVATSKYNKSKIDRTRWYSIDYEKPCLSDLRNECTYQLAESPDGPAKSPHASGEIAASIDPAKSPPLTIERLPLEIDAPAKKPLPENGPAQILVKRYCDLAGVEKPAVYGIAVGTAQKLHDAGITPDDLTAEYRWLKQQSWVKGGVDLGLLLKQVDSWREAGSPGAVPYRNGHDGKPPDEIDRAIAAVRAAKDQPRYFGSDGVKRMKAEIAALEAKRVRP